MKKLSTSYITITSIIFIFSIAIFAYVDSPLSSMHKNSVQPLDLETNFIPNTSKTLNVIGNTNLEKDFCLITLYTISDIDNNLFLVPIEKQVPLSDNKHLHVLNFMLDNTFLYLSPETKILNVSIEDKTALINFNSAVQNSNLGSSAELLTIWSIVNTLTEFSEIEQVLFLIEGEKAETLFGHVSLRFPLRRDDSLIHIQDF